MDHQIGEGHKIGGEKTVLAPQPSISARHSRACGKAAAIPLVRLGGRERGANDTVEQDRTADRWAQA